MTGLLIDDEAIGIQGQCDNKENKSSFIVSVRRTIGMKKSKIPKKHLLDHLVMRRLVSQFNSESNWFTDWLRSRPSSNCSVTCWMSVVWCWLGESVLIKDVDESVCCLCVRAPTPKHGTRHTPHPPPPPPRKPPIAPEHIKRRFGESILDQSFTFSSQHRVTQL